ncbi:hypothetical protein ACFL20_13265, partial [Spirochaetota bacterium]
MKYTKKNKIDNNPPILVGSNILDFDKDKFNFTIKEYSRGLKNFYLYQKFSNYKWPLWINESTRTSSKLFNQITPPFLLNNSMREWETFTNFLSDDELQIDPSLMTSPSYEKWSTELWVALGDTIYRPQNSLANVKIKDVSNTSIIVSTWEEKHFKIVQTICG